MRRLFFGLWIVTSLVMAMGLLIYDVIWQVIGDEADNVWFDEVTGPPWLAVAREAQQAEDPEARLRELLPETPYPVRVRARAELPGEVEAAWKLGYRLGYTSDDEGELMYATLDDQRALVIGPLPYWDYAPTPTHVVVWAVLAALMALVLAAVLWPLYRDQRALEQTAARLAEGDLRARIGLTWTLSPSVVAAFNSMADATEDRVHRQRELLRAVSHELRTPISRLQMAVHLLLGSAPDQQARHADGIREDLTELDELIEELTTFSRVHDVPSVRGATDLAAICEATLVRTAPHAHRTLAAVTGWVDPERFRRVLRNLLQNAIRYGGDRITVTLDPKGTLTVEDNGPGIAPTQRARVLEPFVRLHPDRPGTGLGLAIAHRIVEDHGGQLRIEDAPGGGTRVVTTWPVPDTTEMSPETGAVD